MSTEAYLYRKPPAHHFTLSQRRAHAGRKRVLQPWEEAYVKKAVKLRRRLSNKALAAKLNVSPATISYYANDSHRRMNQQAKQRRIRGGAQ